MIKNTKNDSKEKYAKDIKICLKKKKTKGKQKTQERYQNLTEEEKEKMCKKAKVN